MPSIQEIVSGVVQIVTLAPWLVIPMGFFALLYTYFLVRGISQKISSEPTFIQRHAPLRVTFQVLGVLFMTVFSAIFVFLLVVENGGLVLLFAGGWVILPALIFLGYMLYSMGSKRK